MRVVKAQAVAACLRTAAVCCALIPSSTASPDSPLQNRAPDVSESVFSNLELYARFSSAAYCADESGIINTITNSDHSNSSLAVQVFSGNETDTHGFVAVDEATETIVVAFRGTKTTRNWITNFEFVPIPCDLVEFCLVHAGFQLAWEEVSSAVQEGVAAALDAHPGFTVVTTGHSLGGAVATLAAAHLRSHTPGSRSRRRWDRRSDTTTVDTYTYGSPRVGNAALAKFATGQQQPSSSSGGGSDYRVTHVDDPVPRLPPALLGFRHTSPEYWLSTGNATTVSYSPADVKVCPGLLNMSCNSGTPGFDIDAHSYYLREISDCTGGVAASDGGDADNAAEERPAIDDEDLERLLDSMSKMDARYAAASGGD